MARLAFAFLMAMTVAAPATAVSEATFNCEALHLAALNRWGSKRGQCLVRCQFSRWKGDAERVCIDDADPLNTPMLDTRTLRCVDGATARYLKQAIAACPPEVYPDCGTYGADIASHVQGEVNVSIPRIDPTTVPYFLCDATWAKCGKKTVKALGKLSIAFGRCLIDCARAQQLGGDASRQCLPMNGTFDDVDLTTGLCLALARAQAAEKIARACPGLPDSPGCGIYPLGHGAMLALVENYIAQNFLNPFCAP